MSDPKKSAAFWNDRFSDSAYVYGTAPNDFVVSAVTVHLPTPTDVLDLGAGEGRNAVYLARFGHRVTAVDYAEAALQKTRRLADDRGVILETLQADVATWTPERTWGGVVVTFLHGPTAWRKSLYDLLHRLLRPGGRLIAEWFRPEQRTEGYTSGGPPRADMMVTADELRAHFAEDGIEHLETATPVLNEGPHHRGEAATIRFVWRKPS